MIRLQKLTTMSWFGKRIRKNTKRAQKEYWRIDFRYESIIDVESKIKDEGIISRLKTKTNDTAMLEDHVWIVYGKKDPL